MRKVRRWWQKCRTSFHKRCIEIFILAGLRENIEYSITKARSGIALLLERMWKLREMRKNVV
jgi:hypothetical protein